MVTNIRGATRNLLAKSNRLLAFDRLARQIRPWDEGVCDNQGLLALRVLLLTGIGFEELKLESPKSKIPKPGALTSHIT